MAAGALLWLTLATRMRVPLAKPTLHTVVLGVPSRRCDLMAESASDPCGRAPDRGLRQLSVGLIAEESVACPA